MAAMLVPERRINGSTSERGAEERCLKRVINALAGTRAHVQR